MMILLSSSNYYYYNCDGKREIVAIHAVGEQGCASLTICDPVFLLGLQVYLQIKRFFGINSREFF